MQETEAIAEAVANQANESSRQTSPKKQMIRHSVATQTRLAILIAWDGSTLEQKETEDQESGPVCHFH